MDQFVIMVLGIVFLGTATGTIHKYLDYRLRMAERHTRVGDRTVLQAIDELRAEIAALKRHESDAVLSFDSTLQTLDSRLKHLERRGIDGTASEQPSLAPAEARRPEVARAEGTSPMAAGPLPRSR